MQTATLTYAGPPGTNRTITIGAPEYGTIDTPDPQQEQFKTMGARRYVYDRGPEIRRLDLQFRDRRASEKADVLRFFSASSVNWARRWFTLTVSLPWLEVLRCGALVGGPTIKAGTYVCGEMVAQDSISFRVKLITTPVPFTEELDLFDYELALEVLQEPIPTNT